MIAASATITQQRTTNGKPGSAREELTGRVCGAACIDFRSGRGQNHSQRLLQRPAGTRKPGPSSGRPPQNKKVVAAGSSRKFAPQLHETYSVFPVPMRGVATTSVVHRHITLPGKGPR